MLLLLTHFLSILLLLEFTSLNFFISFSFDYLLYITLLWESKWKLKDIFVVFL